MRQHSMVDLVRRARTGDREAFDLLVERHRTRLESFVELRVWDKLRAFVESDDVVQETLIRAFSSMQGFEWQGESSFFRWLATIAEHVILDLRRRHLETLKRPGNRMVSLDVSSTEKHVKLLGVGKKMSPTPSQVLRRKERLKRLKEAIGQLSEDHREVIFLCLIWGLSIPEAAQRLERSTNAVSMLLLRALRALRKHFGTTESFTLPSTQWKGLFGSHEALFDGGFPKLNGNGTNGGSAHARQ
jgi:RNA polymerase sigma-70 factor (ECF subfamily)